MKKLAFLALAAGALLAVTACPARDFCKEAPLCEDRQAINCVESCQQGPCSTGAHLRDCADPQKCEVVPGRPQSLRFHQDRAMCVADPAACDPTTAPPPRCDGQGNITGCSAYLRVITTSCSQAAVYFERTSCCTTGINEDAGSSADGGLDGGADAGP